MEVNMRRVVWPLLSVMFLVLVPVLSASEPPAVRAAVSVDPQAFFVEKVGGARVEVQVLIPATANHESYSPTVGQMLHLSNADLYFAVGDPHFGFEAVYLEKIKSGTPGLRVIDLSKGIELLPEDPHLWLSPRAVEIQVETIRAALTEYDPAGAAVYEANAAAFRAEIGTLTERIRANFAGLEQRTFLTFHPAWGYFARDFGLTQLAVEEHGKPPGPGELAGLMEKAKGLGIKTVFVQPQSDQRMAETLAAGLGGRTQLVDPLSGTGRSIWSRWRSSSRNRLASRR